MKESRTKTGKALQPAPLDSPVIAELTFEQSLGELERVVGELERDDLTLENALHFFENGIHLIRRCDSHLKSAQGKVKELFKGDNGEFIEKVLGLSLESFLTGESTDD
jgi:exodeoxyribonuclease VII small subunit